MRNFFSPHQSFHAPRQELHNGNFVAHAETPVRADMILHAIGGAELPDDRGKTPIRAIHDAGYLDFLQTGAHRWSAAGRPGDAVGYIWPIVRRRALQLERIDAQLGRYSLDAVTPLTITTWDAAYWSAQSVLAATGAVLGGERAAFALCRPPGHHAGADYFGGYCYLNTAAIAAQYALDSANAGGGKRAGRVAILDIDYHHGNGTQDIFWERGDVFYASVHADPATDYPFYWGHADEVGEGEGHGTTLNLPLPQGATLDTFRRAQATALKAIARFAPDVLILSFGADTWEGDPIAHFKLTTADFATLARDIAACGWPTVIAMEGGYAVDALGANVASLLSGF